MNDLVLIPADGTGDYQVTLPLPAELTTHVRTSGRHQTDVSDVLHTREEIARFITNTLKAQDIPGWTLVHYSATATFVPADRRLRGASWLRRKPADGFLVTLTTTRVPEWKL